MYEVQTDVPIADIDYSAARKTRQRKYPFDQLDVGGMFFVPDKVRNTMASYAWTVGQELNRKFTTRLCVMKREDGRWVPSDLDDIEAVRGIGVWRTE